MHQQLQIPLIKYTHVPYTGYSKLPVSYSSVITCCIAVCISSFRSFNPLSVLHSQLISDQFLYVRHFLVRLRNMEESFRSENQNDFIQNVLNLSPINSLTPSCFTSIYYFPARFSFLFFYFSVILYLYCSFIFTAYIKTERQ